eukprot:scpid81369/ scgid12626/ 
MTFDWHIRGIASRIYSERRTVLGKQGSQGRPHKKLVSWLGAAPSPAASSQRSPATLAKHQWRKAEGYDLATLLYTIGPQATTVFKQLTFDNAGDCEKYPEAETKLSACFKPMSNVIHERMMFERATQSPSETVDEFSASSPPHHGQMRLQGRSR